MLPEIYNILLLEIVVKYFKSYILENKLLEKIMNFTTEEQIENIDKMVFQYMDVILDLVKKISELLEKRKELKNK